MSIGDIIGVPGAGALGFSRDLIAENTALSDLCGQVIAERDRARELAAALEQVCAERERLLRLAIDVHASYQAEAAAWMAIADHLAETT